MTDISFGGRRARKMESDVTLTDEWHEVSLVWDGSLRHLLMDHEEVIVDPSSMANLVSNNEGLYIGAAETLAPEGFWTGLIDDVRIYRRVILPD